MVGSTDLGNFVIDTIYRIYTLLLKIVDSFCAYRARTPLSADYEESYLKKIVVYITSGLRAVPFLKGQAAEREPQKLFG